MDNIQDIVRKYGTSMVATLIGTGVPVHPSAAVWFVDSEAANASDIADGDHGQSFELPLASVFGTAGALVQCSADDVILVAAGHLEPVFGAATWQVPVAKSGVSVIGFSTGGGRNKPLFDYTNTASKIEVLAANVLFKNLNFHANVSAVAIGIDLDYSGEAGVTGNASGFTLEDCEFTEEALATDEFVIAVSIDASVNNVTIKNCTYISQGTNSASVIKTIGACNRLSLIGNHFSETCSAAILDLDATNTVLNVYIVGNNLIGTVAALLCNAATTGVVAGNKMQGTGASLAATVTNLAACAVFENYVAHTLTHSGILYPAVETVD